MKFLITTVFLLMSFNSAFAEDIKLQVTEKGFEPSEIKVKPGTPVTLKITRKTDMTCATEIIMKEKKINQKLPLNQEVTVNVGPLKKGRITFACAMNMISGHIVAE